MENILLEIRQERQRQNEKWGPQDNKPIEWIAILTEEVGEAAKEALDYHFNFPGKKEWKGSQKELQNQRLQNYRKS